MRASRASIENKVDVDDKELLDTNDVVGVVAIL
jgi:hypothetical protein